MSVLVENITITVHLLVRNSLSDLASTEMVTSLKEKNQVLLPMIPIQKHRAIPMKDIPVNMHFL